ncbi:hypothetical protein DAPPUDRAFT_325734 [Daphnia pulex]|uniref:Uncharacterized protein n=1 Tax=Daphnia pulex TaxID=6669 RepID=E9H5E3_DAPPU|nr:hypothetical protein DAPPUDRAFT_325734 [Daphnia pulex]|eukprot:EFX72945.1 hypothetical protein DAPPUDRAFT_325734 [Daphnia pulex]
MSMPNHYRSFIGWFILALLSIPIGIGSLQLSIRILIGLLHINNVRLVAYDYRDSCTCVIPLQLTEAFEGDVYMYKHTHSSNVKTRDDHHLLEKLGDNSGLKAGNYILYLEYKSPVKSFADRKRIIIFTTSLLGSRSVVLLGSKNPFLVIGFTIVINIVLLLCTAFQIITVITLFIT